MEDAHIASVPFSDKKCGLFAVFDGHGGITYHIKVLNVQFLSRNTSAKNLRITRISRKVNTRKHSKRHS